SFKIPADHRGARAMAGIARAVRVGDFSARLRGGQYGSFGIAEIEAGALGADTSADVFFELAMMYSTGRSVPTDFVTAHKWFNIAAMRGNREAIRHRREIAAEMSEADIAAAQRAARDWLQAKGSAEHRAAA
ncbi:MAG: hypothetical protein ACJ8DY_00190, partial [Xanthobacteraceae bacterium]